MIIGISGYIGSGKDLVAKMIQYHFYVKELHSVRVTPSRNFDEFSNWRSDSDREFPSGWQVKKFAGKLKQIVSILTGIPVADLEKQEVKDSELGEEWWFWRETSSWSNMVKIYPYSTHKTAPSFPHCSFIKPTVRWLLQTLGTDAMRDVIHPNIHVNALFADYKTINQQFENYPTVPSGFILGDKHVKYDLDAYPNWLISDMRFPNELEAVKQRKGNTVRINRPLNISSDRAMVMAMQLQAQRHPSETSLDSAEFDYVIENNAGIPELLEQVKQMLTHFKLI